MQSVWKRLEIKESMVIFQASIFNFDIFDVIYDTHLLCIYVVIYFDE